MPERNKQLLDGLAERPWDKRLQELTKQGRDLPDRDEVLAAAFFGAPMVLVVSHAPTGVILDVNERFVEMSGYSREEAIGTTAEELGLYETEFSREELMGLLADTGLVRDIEITFKPKDGSSRDTLVSAFLLRGQEQAFLLVAIVDISKRKALEEQMAQTQRMESLGALAGGIAHDFNNLLVSILGNANLASLELPQDHVAQGFVRNIEKASEQASELVRQMLAYAGRSTLRVEPVDLAKVVRELTRLLRATFPDHHEVKLNLQEPPPVVQGDPTQIRQIVLNLLTNASEAIGAGAGSIEVTVCSCERMCSEHEHFYRSDSFVEGPKACVQVTDDGCGMNAATQSRLFEPFYSTKFAGRGLGLATTIGIVRSHKGAVGVVSEEGKGTTMTVVFPLALGANEPISDAHELRAVRFRGKALLVDDDEGVRELGKMLLERVGFEVECAGDGAEALQVAERTNPDLVILDLTMPRMDGWTCLEGLRATRPQLPVVLVSGYDSTFDDDKKDEVTAFLAKPFRLEQLVEAIQKVRSPVQIVLPSRRPIHPAKQRWLTSK